MEKVIFLGNGKLAEYALAVLERECQVIFHARTKEDLAEVVKLKRENPEAHAVLASYGVMVPEKVLEEFEPEGILNIHPSLLPKYRGASPIESAILAGETEFGVSVMKLVKAMDAGPIYMQATIGGLPLDKDLVYRELAKLGAQMALMVIKTERDKAPETEEAKKWLEKVLHPEAQDEAGATFTSKLTKEMGVLTPDTDTAEETLRKIVAYQWYPKARYALYGKNCLILKAHMLNSGETAPLTLTCADGAKIALDEVQPEGKRPMDAKSFLNGYKK